LSDLRKEDENLGLLYQAVDEIDDKVKEASLTEITPFKWDKAFVFAPGTPREIIYNKVGYEWRDITETEGTDMTLVFIKDNNLYVIYMNI
jgi:hypothetical protein